MNKPELKISYLKNLGLSNSTDNFLEDVFNCRRLSENSDKEPRKVFK